MKIFPKYHVVPLKSSFMLISIFGILITVYLLYPLNPKLGIASLLTFVLMMVASLVSMAEAPIK